MTDDLESLVEEFYDYFLGLYRQERSSDAVATDPFLALLPMGMPISPDEFKFAPPESPPSPQLMTEWLSLVANKVPDIDGTTFNPTLRTADGHYELMLLGATPLPGSNIDLFERLKADAVRLYEQGEMGTSRVGFDFTFRPVVASPANWGDPAAGGIWTGKSFSRSTSSTVTPPSAPTPRPRPLKGWQWKIMKPGTGVSGFETPGINPRAENPVFVSRARPKPQLERAGIGVAAMRQPLSATAVRPSAASSPTVALKARAAAGPATATINPDAVALAMAGRPTALKAQRLERAVAAKTKLGGVALEGGAVPAVKTPLVARTDVLVRHDLILLKQLELVQATTPKKIETTEVSLAFEYCLVSFNRPWMSSVFLSSRGWYVPGFAAGEFSTGSAGGPESENVLLEALPMAALVVRNLRITADFSHEDTSVLRDAASFGPFSLIEREAQEISSSISCPGMQIVAWLCEPLPRLPPASDPALG